MDGLEVLADLRARGRTFPVIVLTARGEEHDKIRGLDVGADDYVTKPFSLGELVARINAALRRVKSERRQTVRVGAADVDCPYFPTTRLHALAAVEAALD